MRCVTAALAVILLLSSTLEAQQGGRWSLGIHGGGDVTDQHTLKLLGAHLGVGIAPGTRIQVAVTSVIEEPGTLLFAGASAQWTPAPWPVRPYIGGGIGVGYQEVGPFSETDFGWLAQAGLRIPFRSVTPFAEIRLFGFTGTTTQILVGFESRAY
jgi:hypothetical protein